MNVLKSKSPIIIGMLIILACMVTCEVTRNENKKTAPVQDTLLLNQWRAVKAQLITGYESRLKLLEKFQASLLKQVAEKKTALVASRAERFRIEHELHEKLIKADTSTYKPADILPVLDSLSAVCNNGNTLCDETIAALEKEVVSKDSSISTLRIVNGTLDDVEKQQDLRLQLLTEQLNCKEKVQRKLIVKNKLFAAGLLVLSGIAGSILILNTVK